VQGFGAETGTAGELGLAISNGLSFIEYNAFDSDLSDYYKIGLKVPFVTIGLRASYRISSFHRPLERTRRSNQSIVDSCCNRDNYKYCANVNNHDDYTTAPEPT
jgi:hypothetical protein